MTETARYDRIVRLSRSEPVNLDGLLAPFELQQPQAGQDIPPCREPCQLPRTRLDRPDAVAVGVVIDRPLADPADAALRLGALALEQDVEVIALSSLDYSGLERFGFRTERLAGTTDEERSACLDQVMRFWGIEVLIPA